VPEDEGGPAADVVVGPARVVALDLGTRRIGVAVSNTEGTLAFPRPAIERHKVLGDDHRAILAVAEETGARVVVVGLPLSLDGSLGPAARAAQVEVETLAGLLGPSGVDVETFDERLTTVSASRALHGAGKDSRAQRQSVDSAAATVLLQAWLEAR